MSHFERVLWTAKNTESLISNEMTFTQSHMLQYIGSSLLTLSVPQLISVSSSDSGDVRQETELFWDQNLDYVLFLCHSLVDCSF